MTVCFLKIIGNPALEFWANINHSFMAVDFMLNYNQERRKRERSSWKTFSGRSISKAGPW